MAKPVSIEKNVDAELDSRIIVKDEKGKDLFGEIIFEFEANGDEFVAYMLDNDENLYVMKYDEEGNLTQPLDDEWPLIEEIVEKYANGEDEEDEE